MERFNLNQISSGNCIYRSGCLFDEPFKIQQSLQNIFHKLEFYFKTWKLSIDLHKCETISFRSSLLYANSNVKKN